MADTQEILQRATRLHQAGQLDEAEFLYRQLLSANPNDAKAMARLGAIAHQRDQNEAAIQLLHRSIAIDAASAASHNNLGEALRSIDRFDEAIDSYLAALKLNPGSVNAWNNLGITLGCQNKLDQAKQCLAEAIRLAPNDEEAHWNLSSALLLSGDYRNGFAEQEWRLLRKESPRRHFAQPAWRGESLHGKTLLLWAEQGLGDMIQFYRYAPLLAQTARRVIVEVHQPLVPLLCGQHENVEVIEGLSNPPPYDVQAPLMSAAHLTRSTLESLPRDTSYLRADESITARWKQVLGPRNNNERLRVGIVWAGRPEHVNDRRRSCHLNDFAPLAGLQGVTFYALQKGSAALEATSPPRGMMLISLSDQIQSFNDTAAIISQLDLAICVDTSVAHLAGALGKPVWVLLPFSPDWRWLMERSDSPWYPTMRLFRQPKTGDWGSVFTSVRRSLEKM